MFHVADNLRIFAERLEGVFAGAPTTLAAYDQDELAAARNYDAMSLPVGACGRCAPRTDGVVLGRARVAHPSVHVPARGAR